MQRSRRAVGQAVVHNLIWRRIMLQLPMEVSLPAIDCLHTKYICFSFISLSYVSFVRNLEQEKYLLEMHD